MCLCVFFKEVWCQPPRLAFFVGQTFALIKNLQGNVNWPVEGGIITSSSLSIQVHAHMCTNPHTFFYGTAKQWRQGFGKASFPPVWLLDVPAWQRNNKSVWCFALFLPRSGFAPFERSRPTGEPRAASPNGTWHGSRAEGALLTRILWLFLSECCFLLERYIYFITHIWEWKAVKWACREPWEGSQN